MRVSKLRLKNFLSFGNEQQELTFDSPSIIVGPNDAGKTNIFRALSVIGEVFRKQNFDLKPYYHAGDLDQSLEIEADVQFSQTETQALTDFLACSAVLTDITAQKPDEVELVSKLKDELLAGVGRKMYDNFFRQTTVQVSGPWLETLPPDVHIRILLENQEFFLQRNSVLHTGPRPAYPYSLMSLVQVFLEKARAGGKQDSLETGSVVPFVAKALDQQGTRGISIPGFHSGNVEQRLGLRAEYRRLLRFMRASGFAESYFDLFSLFGLIFNSSVSRVADFRSPSRADLDLMPREERKSTLHFLAGGELTKILFQLKNSSNPKDGRCLNSILSEFRTLSNGAECDIGIETERVPTELPTELVTISSDAGLAVQPIRAEPQAQVRPLGVRNKQTHELRHTATIQIRTGGFAVPIELAAAGLFELLVLLTILTAQDDATILLDEPALNLHPAIQRRLHALLQKSMVENRNQIILITHSPYLIDVSNLDNTWRVGRHNNSSIVHSVGQALLQLTGDGKKRILFQLGRTELRALLFSRGVIFVEGASDRVVIEKADRYLSSVSRGADLEGEEWAVISVEGKDSLGTFLNLAVTLDVPYAAVLDYDALMSCDKTIDQGSRRILTSSAFYAVNRAGQISPSELEQLSTLGQTCITLEGAHWYPQEHLEQLNKIARSHNIFILKADLEGAIQTPRTGKEKKPLQAMESIVAMISTNTIPTEVEAIVAFLHERISETMKA